MALQEPPLPPVFAFTKTPNWDDAEEQMRLAFDEVGQALGEQSFAFEVPSVFHDAWQWHATIMEADLARNLPRALRARSRPAERVAARASSSAGGG